MKGERSKMAEVPAVPGKLPRFRRPEARGGVTQSRRFAPDADSERRDWCVTHCEYATCRFAGAGGGLEGVHFMLPKIRDGASRTRAAAPDLTAIRYRYLLNIHAHRCRGNSAG